MRVITLNLNGIRSAFSKGFPTWLSRQRADVICLQEIKAQAADMTAKMINPPGYYGYFHYAQKKGYSGVGIYARQRPDRVIEGLGIKDIDAEGRYIELVFGTLSVVSVYLPSGSSGEHRQAEKFRFMKRFYPHLVKLTRSGREVILCGDWNIAHREIDLRNWKSNQKNSGFLPEERAWMTRVLDGLGWIDVYRRLCPDATGEGYTWWSNRGQARAKNVGWRIDYQIASAGIAATAREATIYKSRRFSDHAPLSIDFDWNL
ncbi:MAG: exodeoxyribonuclease III [Betaproteobacteria bacterium RIFCSPLOWO2_02_FULL_63_19]|nr:MAG: exodeoxyribonuclease III [Betaproteobacteria bacterium RIFCSPLOWO2_02_FULL_63_19]